MKVRSGEYRYIHDVYCLFSRIILGSYIRVGFLTPLFCHSRHRVQHPLGALLQAVRWFTASHYGKRSKFRVEVIRYKNPFFGEILKQASKRSILMQYTPTSAKIRGVLSTCTRIVAEWVCKLRMVLSRLPYLPYLPYTSDGRVELYHTLLY